jgi:4-hydroxybenzoate-CoA ligase
MPHGDAFDPSSDLPRDYNAARWFIHRHVEQGSGQRIAVIDDAGTTTYAALAAGVNRCGNALRGMGLRMEDRVVICMLDTVDFPFAFWGAIQAGIVPIPINTLLTSKDYAYMLQDSRARALLVSDALYDKFAPILAECPFLEHVVVSGERVGGHPLFSDLLAAAPETAEIAPTTRDDVAFWLYSSGSTGAPKGAMHLQRDLMATAVLYGEGVLGVTRDDVVFSAAKLFFAYGLGNGMTFPLHAGATAILMKERPTPDAVMRVMAAHNPTLYFGVPTLYSAILAAPDAVQAQRSNRLRLCVSAGEALPEDVGKRWEQRFGAPIADGLGSTEMLHIFVSNRPDDIRYGTSGKPVPGYEVQIVDEDDRPVPRGELGELVVCGPSAAMAYWNQREKSLKTFRGAWTYTGDKYFEDEDGYLHYAGRADDMLKVSGNWVSPTEVEATLICHESVLEVAVIGAPDEAGLIKAKAFVVLKQGYEASETMTAELQVFVKTRLAPYKYPRWIVFLDSLPKTATGKIQRFRLREFDGSGHA